MRKELDEALCKKYPKIFRDRTGNMQETAMCWGMEHGDGWHDILDALCASIQCHIDNNARTLKWHQLYLADREMAARGNWDFFYGMYKGKEDWLRDNPDWVEARKQEYLGPLPEWRNSIEEVPQVVAVQVKEKYGTLRFYYNGGDDKIDGMVAMAEIMSARVCETCGSPGKLRKGGWIRTLCDHHAKEQGYVLEEVNPL